MILKKILESALRKLPYLGRLYTENMNFKKNSCFPPGHFYSPIISVEDVKERQDEIWSHAQQDRLQGIELNTGYQKELIKEFYKYYNDMPFTGISNSKNRYYFENEYYSYTDGVILYSIIRHFSPKQIIEIGSGFSSALMLDINNLFFDNNIDLTFIEPFPDRLNKLVRKDDVSSFTIIEKGIQNIDPSFFKKLDSGDILFIDSTHVAKTGSDVNYILFEIMPVLKSGVLIHFHDIFYPFEYPKEWVFMGRNWNENYFLRAFLMYNKKFEIVFFSHYLHTHHKNIFNQMPLSHKNTGGNIWIRKTNS
jgi:predicted O-methyltransferase YrrM